VNCYDLNQQTSNNFNDIKFIITFLLDTKWPKKSISKTAEDYLT